MTQETPEQIAEYMAREIADTLHLMDDGYSWSMAVTLIKDFILSERRKTAEAEKKYDFCYAKADSLEHKLSEAEKEIKNLSDFIASTDIHTVYELQTKKESQLKSKLSEASQTIGTMRNALHTALLAFNTQEISKPKAIEIISEALALQGKGEV